MAIVNKREVFKEQNKVMNRDVIIKGKQLEKYICPDCHQVFFNYNYNLCPNCDSVQSGDITDTMYIFSDCFSYANGKPNQMSGFCTLITNDRFDLDDEYNIEEIILKAFKNTTNNFGELMGVLAGLDYFINNVDDIYKDSYKNIIVISDSEYVIKGASERMYKWKKNGWTNTSGEVKNLELWKTMMNLCNYIKKDLGKNLVFQHQKGHVGKHITKEEEPIIYLQEICDTKATDLKKKLIAKNN